MFDWIIKKIIGTKNQCTVKRLQPVVAEINRLEAQLQNESDEALRPGIDRFLDRMGDAGIEVLGIRDNPRFGFDMYSCVAEASDPVECAVPRAGSLADDNPAVVLDRAGVQLVDLTPWICPDDVCVGVVGNVVLYRDDNHLSRTYAATLAPLLAEQLPPSLG